VSASLGTGNTGERRVFTPAALSAVRTALRFKDADQLTALRVCRGGGLSS